MGTLIWLATPTTTDGSAPRRRSRAPPPRPQVPSPRTGAFFAPLLAGSAESILQLPRSEPSRPPPPPHHPPPLRAPSVGIHLRPRLALRQDSAPDSLVAGVTALDLAILFPTRRGQGLAAAVGTAYVGPQVDPGGGAPVRHARTPRQAHRDLAPGLALHVVRSLSSSAASLLVCVFSQ